MLAVTKWKPFLALEEGNNTIHCSLPQQVPSGCSLPCTTSLSLSYSSREFPILDDFVYKNFTFFEDFAVFWASPSVLVPTVDPQDIELRGTGFFGSGWTEGLASCRVGGEQAIATTLVKYNNRSASTRTVSHSKQLDVHPCCRLCHHVGDLSKRYRLD